VKENGYEVVSLERWLDAGGPAVRPTVLLRHDVDQAPAAALRMLAIDAAEGVRGTWYFRWRTARPDVVATVRAEGADVGLHYETLTRLALARGIEAREAERLVPEARDLLRREISVFGARFGAIRSVCPHGDTRAPGIRNAVLLEGERWGDYGIIYDGNAAMRGRPLDTWLTDRTGRDGRWADGVDPLALLAAGASPLLCVTHPNNWASGFTLWSDRLARGLAGAPGGSLAARRAPTDEPVDL
jgi:hypothetical protein